ncbi:MAG TPA: hypothetical protein VF748_13350 [Candidatus Acidoferrum sp.]
MQSALGYRMLCNKALFFLVLVSALAFSSCTLHRKSGGGGGGGGGTATVSFTLIADTLPANPSILSFKVSVSSVVLTPASGSTQTLTPATAVVDLMRLQSDTAFLGKLTNVPSGSYTIKVAFSNPVITFLNDTASAITAGSASCASAAVCVFSLSASGTPTIGSFTVNVTASGQLGVGIDFNLNNAISLSSGALSVNFNPSSPVLSAFTLPRSNANLGNNQLDLIEDFTGVVALNGNNVTLTSPTRGTLTVVNNSSSFFDPSPDATICATPATFSCVVSGQVASVDAVLNSDGTLSLKEFEPLFSTSQDLVEGTVFSVTGNGTQFAMTVADKTQAASGSLITAVNTGALLTVNLSPSVKPFLVDTKGLLVANAFPSSFSNFATQTTTAAIHDGQTVSVHVTALTTASGTTPASATVDTVILRWSRFRATVVSATSSVVNVNALPSYFNASSGFAFVVQGFFNGSPGSDGVTNLDGIATNAGSVTANQPVGLRALYLQNTTGSANPAFFAAKMRQP